MEQATATQVLHGLGEIPIVALWGAVIVQFATLRVAGFKPRFGVAYLAALLGAAAGLVIGFLIGFILAPEGRQGFGTMTLFSTVLGFFVQAGFYTLLLKHPETGGIIYRKACLIALIQLVIGVVVIGVIALLLLGLTALPRG